MKKRDWSPTDRKRGSVPATTTGSRTITSALALPTRSFAPGDRHHPHRAVEGRDVEGDLGGAVRPDLDHAGVAGERLLRRRDRVLDRPPAVAAGADRAARALHAVDEVAVEIAQLRRELLLAEEIVVGIRRLVAGQVEDADIDRRDRDVASSPGVEPGDLDRQIASGAARPHLLAGAEQTSI